MSQTWEVGVMPAGFFLTCFKANANVHPHKKKSFASFKLSMPPR